MKKILILFFTVSLMMISAPRESTDSRENIINHLDINYSYNIAESLARLVDRVRENFKHRVLAALQPVRAEDDAWTLAHALRALEHRDAIVAIGCR